MSVLTILFGSIQFFLLQDLRDHGLFPATMETFKVILACHEANHTVLARFALVLQAQHESVRNERGYMHRGKRSNTCETIVTYTRTIQLFRLLYIYVFELRVQQRANRRDDIVSSFLVCFISHILALFTRTRHSLYSAKKG